jgi:DNA-binding CsgD family transcriptional regulator
MKMREALESLEETLSQIGDATNLDDLTVVLKNLCAPFNLANIVYHAIKIPGSKSMYPILLFTYETEWVRRYIERDYLRLDPIVISGRRGFLPIDWSMVDHESASARQFFGEADRYGVGRQGVTVPVRGPVGERALFTITSNASSNEWRNRRIAYMREFQIIAHYVHDQAARLSGFRTSCQTPTVSQRERECLEGISNGLAPKQIAAQLNISSTAVQLYLQSARHKLACTSTAQAVVRAARLELIEIL